MIQNLVEDIKNKKAHIGIVGLGYVGIPLALRFSEVDFQVSGFDIDESKITSLNNGQSYIEHISDDAITHAQKKGFTSTNDFSLISKCDHIIICVPTPLNKYREPNLSYVIDTVETIAPYLRSNQLLSLESTTYPGTTEEELAPRIEKLGFTIGKDFFLVFSPEREDPGNLNFNTQTIPKVCGGHTPNCLELGIALYHAIIDQVVPVSSTKAAEFTKLLENIHRAVNIGLVNELKVVADRMNLDIYEIIDAAATKPFGFTPYYPGPGLGGHCIPIDPFYLTWKAREYGLHTRFIELAGEINNSMPDYVVEKLTEALNERGKAVKDSQILVLGIAYKKDVDDMRESPSVKLMELLRNKSAKVSYSDPHVPVFPKMREHFFDLSSVEITKESIASYDAVLIATNHSKFDYKMIKDHACLLIDTRGVYRQKSDHIVKA